MEPEIVEPATEVLDPEPEPVAAGASLANRSTVRELVAVWERTEREVRAAFAAIELAERRLNIAFTLGEAPHKSISVDASRGRGADNFGDPDDCIERMQRQAWSELVDRLELRRVLSAERWRLLQKRLDGRDPDQPPMPRITEENVVAFAREYGEGMRELFAEKVAAVFERLRPHHSEYKTNTELEVGERVILNCIVERAFRGGFRLNYHDRSGQLAELESVFQALDGQGDAVKVHRSQLEDAIEASGKAGVGRTAYFEFRCHKKGTLHLKFTRMDLVRRLNIIAGGARLRPAPER